MADETCTVSGTFKDASGTAVDGVELSFLAAAPYGIDANQLTTTKITVTSGAGAWAAGYFEVVLLREIEVRLLCNLARLNDIVITIPDSATADLATLTEAAK